MNTKRKVIPGKGRKKAKTGEEELSHQVMEVNLRRAVEQPTERGETVIQETNQQEVIPLAASKEEDLDYKPDEEEEPVRLGEKQVGASPKAAKSGGFGLGDYER